VQTGALGLALFLTLLLVMLWYSRTLGQPNNWLAQGLVLTMAVGCLFNSSLLDMAEGHFFAFFTALFFAGLDRRRPGKI
ncbi:MAG: lipid A core--O-antigen ligase, partial [Deltaproteobacteria bacterium CG_4_10_14_3_um_filter_60_8]